MNTYQIKNGILYIDSDQQSIELCNEIYSISERYSSKMKKVKRCDFPASLVFISEPNLFNLIKNKFIFYIITCNKDDPECYDATVRAMNYHKNPGLQF
jgi:hypothetical protein